MENWKEPGLPHKGWKYLHVDDLGGLDGACEWCSTAIRYEHHLYHPELNIETTAGCICAEHLTQDYVTPRQAEKDLKKKIKLENKLFINFYTGFKPAKRNPLNIYVSLKELSTFVVIFPKNGGYALKINSLFGRKIYQSIEKAKDAAWNYITKKLL